MVKSAASQQLGLCRPADNTDDDDNDVDGDDDDIDVHGCNENGARLGELTKAGPMTTSLQQRNKHSVQDWNIHRHKNGINDTNTSSE